MNARSRSRALTLVVCVAALSPGVALAVDKPLILPPAHIVKPHLPPATPTAASTQTASPGVAETLDARGLGEARIQTPPFFFNKDGTPYRPGQDTDPLGKAPDFWRLLFVWRGALKPPVQPVLATPVPPVGRIRPTFLPPTAPVAPASK